MSPYYWTQFVPAGEKQSSKSIFFTFRVVYIQLLIGIEIEAASGPQLLTVFDCSVTNDTVFDIANLQEMSRAVDTQCPLCGEFGIDDFKNRSVFGYSFHDWVDE